MASGDFNPRSPCGERRFELAGAARDAGISIHAPRVGSDVKNEIIPFQQLISIHAPRVGSDMPTNFIKVFFVIFQSTLPVWGATGIVRVKYIVIRTFQSTLPVWGATE